MEKMQPSVADAIEKYSHEFVAPLRADELSVIKLPRKARKKGKPKSKILKSYVANGQRHELHATKGWRTYRA